MLGVALLLASLMAQTEDPAYALPEPPGPPVPRAPIDGPADGPNTVSVTGRFAYRMSVAGEVATDASSIGFALGAGLEHRYATLNGWLELGAGLSMRFDSFRTSPDLSNFVAMQTAAVRVGPGRVSAGVGAGLAVAQMSGPGVLHPVARAVLGIEVPLRGHTALALSADYTRILTHSSYGDLLDAGAGLLYRF
jgi:hypothetical protein